MPDCRVGVGGDDRDVGGGGELAWVVLVMVLVCVWCSLVVYEIGAECAVGNGQR